MAHLLPAPSQEISGGKPVKKRKGAAAPVAVSVRPCAWQPRRYATARRLGAYYRQIARHKGADVAIFATARKLATLIYRLLRWGNSYVDEGAEAYEKRYREARLQRLTAIAKDLGYQLAPLAAKA